jgi:TolB-like protein/DNA-binding winged helix-turn-helix (wHTH) protein/Tfp pilus assembly protein PilF
MEADKLGGVVYLFGAYSLDSARRELRRGNHLVAIEPQVFDILEFLICNRERVVSKDDLIAAVWGGRIVSDSALSSRITAVRHAIGDGGETQRLIRTLPRKGLRFVGEVREEHPSNWNGACLLSPRSFEKLEESVQVLAVDRPTRAVEPPAGIAHPCPSLKPMHHPSIAVLPLNNHSGDPTNDHLCGAIAEDVIESLSRFRSLRVIARHSAFRLRSRSARALSRSLGVDYLLSGSLRQSGKRVRIVVELIETVSEGVVWSDHFDIRADESFELRDEITGAVASRLAVRIDLAEGRYESRHPSDTRTHGLVLCGQHLTLRFAKEANSQARRLFEEAITIAPSYGRAYSAMSRTHNLDWRYSWSPNPDRSLDLAVELARQAIQRDPLDARGYAELGYAHLYKKNHDESLTEYERALALNPNDADIIAEYADSLVYAGQPQKSIELLERAMRLNPHYPDWYLWYLADAYDCMGASGDVITAVHRMQNPAEGRRLLAANFAHLGRMEEARREASEVMRLHPEFSIGRWQQRPPYQDTAPLERFVEGLRKAGLPD